MSGFEKSWKRSEEGGSFGRRTREAVRGPQPIRPQIQKASTQLQSEVKKLDSALARLNQKESSIFRKTVQSVQAHDEESSKAFSNELSEVRKMKKIVTQSRVALQQISVRLQTVTEMGDFASTVAQAVGVVRTVRRALGEAVPDAQDTLGELGAQLNTMLVDVGQITETNFSLGESNEDAQKILAEATAIAEKRVNQTFPDIPDATTADEPILTGGEEG